AQTRPAFHGMDGVAEHLAQEDTLCRRFGAFVLARFKSYFVRGNEPRRCSPPPKRDRDIVIGSRSTVVGVWASPSPPPLCTGSFSVCQPNTMTRSGGIVEFFLRS